MAAVIIRRELCSRNAKSVKNRMQYNLKCEGMTMTAYWVLCMERGGGVCGFGWQIMAILNMFFKIIFVPSSLFFSLWKQRKTRELLIKSIDWAPNMWRSSW